MACGDVLLVAHQEILYSDSLTTKSSLVSLLLGFLLEKKIGVNQPKRIEDARILIANTSMDTDKIKVFGSKVRVQSTAKLAEIEKAEKVCLCKWVVVT